jgi:hypothetical protein
LFIYLSVNLSIFLLIYYVSIYPSIYLSYIYLAVFLFSNYLYILGIITTIAGNGSSSYSGDGGLATSATLNYPIGVDIDHITGDVYIADFYNHRIRLITNSSGKNYIYYNQIITNEYLYNYLSI